jgi:DNA-binding transcriptional ArsR family regulator
VDPFASVKGKTVKLSELEDAYRKWLYLEHDPEIIRSLFALYLANRYDGPPVWTMVIGKAGCGKSELLGSLDGFDATVMVSKLTPNALASGYGDGSTSLLYALSQNKVMVIKDMSTITEMASEAKAQIFSDLRDAFDGSFVKVTGSGRVDFKGKFGIIAGATEAVERSRIQESSLGERFLYLRVRMEKKHEILIQNRSGSNVNRFTDMRKELTAAAGKFLKGITLGKNTKITEGLRDDIYMAARVLVRARGAVTRDRFTRNVESPAGSNEVPTRVTAQLLEVALALQEMGCTEAEMRKLVFRVCLDSMPGTRYRIMTSLVRGNERAADIRNDIRMSAPTIEQHLDDLWYLELAGKDQMGRWAVTDTDLIEMIKTAV